MANLIKCSNCGKMFDANDAFTWKAHGFKQIVCSECDYDKQIANREIENTEV